MNLTERAHKEAHERYQGDWDAFEQEPVDDMGFSESERRAFIAGAEWAARQDPTAAEVLTALNRYYRSMRAPRLREDMPLSYWSATAVGAMRSALHAARGQV